MTTRINLLPWRAERRRLREREFYTMLGGAAIVGVLAVFLWSMITGAVVDNQTARNTYLSSEIAEMDTRIEKINELDKTKSRLIGRKNAIELLQANRSQMVHLLDELVVTIPDGVRLTGLKQVSDQLTLEGIAESNTRVATYMRNIDRSQWMGRSEVTKIENRTGLDGADPRLPYQFSLSVKLLKAGDQKSPEDIAAAAAAADMAEAIQLAPGDLRVTPAKSAEPDATAVPADTANPAPPANPDPALPVGTDSPPVEPNPVQAISPSAPAEPESAQPVNDSAQPANLPSQEPTR
ncbi:MAG: PilN domain-containing protein [Dokdonella sp.]